MHGEFSTFLQGALVIMLLVAAFGDLRSREISNSLNGAIALLALPYWLSLGMSGPDMAMQAGVAAIVFALFALLFRFGWMGGGDVKLLTAVALWLPAGAVLNLLVIMSLAGGALTVIMLIRQHLSKSRAEIEVPYGVAIAFGGFWVIAEPFFNHFA